MPPGAGHGGGGAHLVALLVDGAGGMVDDHLEEVEQRPERVPIGSRHQRDEEVQSSQPLLPTLHL